MFYTIARKLAIWSHHLNCFNISVTFSSPFGIGISNPASSLVLRPIIFIPFLNSLWMKHLFLSSTISFLSSYSWGGAPNNNYTGASKFLGCPKSISILCFIIRLSTLFTTYAGAFPFPNKSSTPTFGCSFFGSSSASCFALPN